MNEIFITGQSLIKTAGDPWPTWAFVMALIGLALALGALAAIVNERRLLARGRSWHSEVDAKTRRHEIMSCHRGGSEAR